MKHARSDYNRIQDPEGKIPDDEPVFLLRGQDVCAPQAIEAWCAMAMEMRVDLKMIKAAAEQAKAMRAWHKMKTPDMPNDK